MKLIAAMSGGVDSSVAAALALRQSHEVIGVTLRLKHPDPDFSAAQLCVGRSDEAAVLSVCAALGMEHRFVERFPAFSERVLRPAALEYLAGLTPNPCCNCNELVKFATLFEIADELGADGVLTGHYARIERASGDVRLLRGSDPAKDQTYFLYRLRRWMLARLYFPVGDLTKPEVRKEAAKMGLVTAEKRDSQDACFQVPGECFGETLRRLFELAPKPGNFVYRGRAVGRHGGIHQYTLGQRKGLGVALGVPAYVAAIDAITGDIVLETEEGVLLKDSFRVGAVNSLLAGSFPERMQVQVRYRSRAVPARLEPEGDGGYRVWLDEPQRAVTPGQSAVFYDDRMLLGGGIIQK